MSRQTRWTLLWCGAVLLFLQLDRGYCLRDKERDAKKRNRQPKYNMLPTDRRHRLGPEYTGESANVSRLLDSLSFGYDKRLRPNYKGPPVEVTVTMHISSVSAISEVDMDFTVDMYFRQIWTDKRLAFPESEGELCISNEMLEKIWWPDTFFANAKFANFHLTTTNNAFLRIKYTGEILLSLRLTVNAMCFMDLTYFPMDSQKCTLEVESYGYSTSDIAYNWKEEDPVSIAKDVQLPQFVVTGHIPNYRLQVLSTGNYSRLSCEFYFKRSLGYYIIQIYVPSCLIVVLSWVSFWLSIDAVPARVALGITTVLTMTTLISSTNASLPKISYLKSIDVYLVTCFVMVFSSLVEYAAVSYIANRSKRKTATPKRRNSDVLLEKVPNNLSPIMYRKNSMGCESMDPTLATEVRLTSLRKLHTECDIRSNLPPGSVNTNYGQCRNNRTPDDLHNEESKQDSCVLTNTALIDKYSRAVFPLMFIGFNLLYWIAYLNVSSSQSPYMLPGFVPLNPPDDE